MTEPTTPEAILTEGKVVHVLCNFFCLFGEMKQKEPEARKRVQQWRYSVQYFSHKAFSMQIESSTRVNLDLGTIVVLQIAYSVVTPDVGVSFLSNRQHGKLFRKANLLKKCEAPR
jgi:hypothetical protein